MNDKRTDIDRFDPRLAKTCARDQDRQQHYDDWAHSYESDLVDDLDYVAYRDAGRIFAANVEDRGARILDVACGTGLVGAFLKSQGYEQVDGADFSREMLARAGHRRVYQALWQQDFTTPKRLDTPYEALICVGLFAFGIPAISDLHHVVDCVIPNGLRVVTVNGTAWRQLQLEPEVYRAAELHGFRIEQVIETGYIRKQGIDARVLVIRR